MVSTVKFTRMNLNLMCSDCIVGLMDGSTVVDGCRGDSMERPPTEKPMGRSRKEYGRMAGALAAGCQSRSHPG